MLAGKPLPPTFLCSYAASTLAMCLIKSTTLHEYPHSLSYQATSFTKVGSIMMPALESKVLEIVQVSKSVDTRLSSQYPRKPFMSPSDRLLTSAQISSYVVGFSNSQVRSTTDTSMVGTRNAMPVSLPFIAGITLATALAAPVDEGMMLPDAARPPRQSFFEEPSTVGCDAVIAWIVVMRPLLMLNLSWIAFTSGASPFVVQEAQDTHSMEESYVSWFTPITTVCESSLAGAEKTTFFAPAFRWGSIFSVVKNTPVDSQTYSAPCSVKGISAGSRVCDKATPH